MKVLVSMFLILLTFIGRAQEYPRENIDPATITDDLGSFQEDDINYEDLYENYLQLYADPVNLNKASAEQLRMLNLLSESQVQNLLQHINEHGNLLSVYELQAVPGFDLALIHRIIPFVFVADPREQLDQSVLKRILSKNNSYFVSRYSRTLQKSAGFESEQDADKKFAGSPDRLYMRFRTSKPNDFSFGFTTEKDAGERIEWKPGEKQYGADYWSWHVQVRNKKVIQNLIIGDYQCQFGQGLLLGSAFGLGKGGETINTIRKSNVGFLPYTSVNEAGYLRGVAATLNIHKLITTSAFYSDTWRDANVDGGENPSFSSIAVSGLHRNSKELADRKVVRERCYGAVVNYKKETLDAGVIFQGINFSIPIIKDPSPYNQFAFQGNNNINGSVYVNYVLRNANLFAEAGQTLHHGKGFVSGALVSVHQQVDMAVLYRNYERNFYTFYANAFAENTTAQNESGMYWGWKYRINKKYSAATYVDLFRFPWLKFRSYKPSQGHEFLIRFNYQPSRKIMMFAQFRQETKEKNIASDHQTYVTDTGTKKNLWLNVDYALGQHLRTKTRAQFSHYSINDASGNGMTLLQDVTFSIKKFQLSARYALFDTDDFDNRQYVFENDVWLAYSLPAYNGTGVKNYFMMEYKFNSHITVWIRISGVKYLNQTESGSGENLIKGNKVNDVKFQLRLTF